jgi:integrase
VVKGFTSDNPSSFYSNAINNVQHSKLKEYKKFLLKELKPSSVNQNLAAVVEYYWWLQKNKRTEYRYLCGWADNELGIPKHRIEVKPPKKDGEFSNPLLIKGTANNKIGYVPSSKEMAEIARLIVLLAKQSAPKSKVDLSDAYKERNLLILDWMSQAGVRREELRMMQTSVIHDAKTNAQNDEDGIEQQVAKLRGEEYERREIRKLVKVEIKTGLKNRKERVVHITPDLLERTIDYIDFEREDILDSGKCKDTGEVFVVVARKAEGSSCRMSKPYINNIFKFDMKLGGEQVSKDKDDVIPHALRRYALKQYAIILWQVELDRVSKGTKDKVDEIAVLNALRNFAGHNEADTTLKHYVDITKAIAEAGELAEDETRAEIEFQRIRIATLEESLNG